MSTTKNPGWNQGTINSNRNQRIPASDPAVKPPRPPSWWRGGDNEQRIEVYTPEHAAKLNRIRGTWLAGYSVVALLADRPTHRKRKTGSTEGRHG